MKILEPTPEAFEEAAEVLWEGGIVAYPTETVYGLAVDPFIEEAVKKLFHAKERPENKPVLLIVDDETHLFDAVESVDEIAETYIEAFWPGPLTLLLPRAPELPQGVTAGAPKVAVRCPDCAIARRLCRQYGGPLTSSSANRSGAPPALDLAELDLAGVDLAIDGGRIEAALPSTLFDPETGVVLREGPISLAQLEEAARR